MSMKCRVLCMVPLLVLAVVVQVSAAGLTVEIMQPCDGIEVTVGQECTFEAVAYLDGQELEAGAVTWEWDFGDATPHSLTNPTTHAYMAPGSYTGVASARCGELTGQARVLLFAGSTKMGEFVALAGYQRPPDVPFPQDVGSSVWDAVTLMYRVSPTGGMSLRGCRFYQLDGEGQWIRVDLAGDDGWVWKGADVLVDGLTHQNATWVWDTRVCKNRQLCFRVEALFERGPDIIVEDLYRAWTPNNTVVRDTTTGVDALLIKWPKDREPSATIGWNVTHHEVVAPKYKVEVKCYDVCRTPTSQDPVDTVADPSYSRNAGSGAFSWTPPGPSKVGIYSYSITADHYECADTDKVDAISNVSLSDFTWDTDDYPDAAFVALHYTCSQGLSGCELLLFKPDLSEGTILSGIALDGSVGQHLAVVKFAVDRQIMGDYRFVLTGTQADGSANRDETPKPTIPRGAAVQLLPRVRICAGSGISSGFFSGAKNATEERFAAYNLANHPPYDVGEVAQTKQAVYRAVQDAAIFAYYGHADPGYVSPGQPDPDEVFRCTDLPLDMDHVLLALWMGCNTAQGNGGSDMVTGSVTNGASCAIGWTVEIAAGYLPPFASYFWDCACTGLNAAKSCSLAALWAYGDIGDECGDDILDHRVEGNVILVPSRFGGG
ncbi:PKD domain-containing protein [bacterium]|nr:PKD domain-containing protein [bacterium]